MIQDVSNTNLSRLCAPAELFFYASYADSHVCTGGLAPGGIKPRSRFTGFGLMSAYLRGHHLVGRVGDNVQSLRA